MTLRDSENTQTLQLRAVPLDQLVPRLYYTPASPPDAFDAFNLMMAEYSRNGLSMPVGDDGDVIAHFRTTLRSTDPWTLDGAYDFQPNPQFRPYRVSVTNNCLGPGLWELAAVDRAGELYHAWFSIPAEVYLPLVARANGLDHSFTASALTWDPGPRPLDLERLRTERESYGEVPTTPVQQREPVGYSSQGSRQKIARGFVRVEKEGQLAAPVTLGELTALPLHLTSFVAPGKYSASQRRRFDLDFLAHPETAEIRRVEPRTRYAPERGPDSIDHSGAPHLEIRIAFGSRKLVLGNLPLPLLVEQEDFAIHGFGVGILAAGDLAERRALLLRQGPAPSYAFLIERSGHESLVVNTHELGLEQIFLRTRPFADPPHWEITLSSYERIVDLVKYRVPIPEPLLESLMESSRRYVSPLYFSYRDDNLR
ncbi:MAG: hypothetical protein AAGC60_14975 [Acidobacteriota bacterium]